MSTNEKKGKVSENLTTTDLSVDTSLSSSKSVLSSTSSFTRPSTPQPPLPPSNPFWKVFRVRANTMSELSVSYSNLRNKSFKSKSSFNVTPILQDKDGKFFYEVRTLNANSEITLNKIRNLVPHTVEVFEVSVSSSQSAEGPGSVASSGSSVAIFSVEKSQKDK